jgi:hypothetical protein
MRFPPLVLTMGPSTPASSVAKLIAGSLPQGPGVREAGVISAGVSDKWFYSVAHHDQQDYAPGTSPRPSGLTHPGVGTPVKWRSPRSDPGEPRGQTSRPSGKSLARSSRTCPHIRCFRCLSLQVGVLEKDAREAAQILVVRNDFFVARRSCQICARTDSALVSGKEP